jgi:hypothetical protein
VDEDEVWLNLRGEEIEIGFLWKRRKSIAWLRFLSSLWLELWTKNMYIKVNRYLLGLMMVIRTSDQTIQKNKLKNLEEESNTRTNLRIVIHSCEIGSIEVTEDVIFFLCFLGESLGISTQANDVFLENPINDCLLSPPDIWFSKWFEESLPVVQKSLLLQNEMKFLYLDKVCLM